MINLAGFNFTDPLGIQNKGGRPKTVSPMKIQTALANPSNTSLGIVAQPDIMKLTVDRYMKAGELPRTMKTRTTLSESRRGTAIHRGWQQNNASPHMRKLPNG